MPFIKIAVNHKDSRKGNYAYLPFSHMTFFKGLKKILEEQGKKPKDVRFLDVGCGMGTKLILAQILKIGTVHGIEVNKNYAKIAQRLQGVTIHQMDAIKFKNYGQYDVIYLYHPIQNEKKSVGLDRLVRTEMNEDAVLLYPTTITKSAYDNS